MPGVLVFKGFAANAHSSLLLVVNRRSLVASSTVASSVMLLIRRSSFDIGVQVVTVQQDSAAVAARAELAEGNQVVEPILAAAQPLGCLRDIEPGRGCRCGRRNQRGGALGDLRDLLVGEP
jgi:hypothetical protein